MFNCCTCQTGVAELDRVGVLIAVLQCHFKGIFYTSDYLRSVIRDDSALLNSCDCRCLTEQVLHQRIKCDLVGVIQRTWYLFE